MKPSTPDEALSVARRINGAWNGQPETYHVAREYPDAFFDGYPDPLFAPDPRRFKCLAPPPILSTDCLDRLRSPKGGQGAA